MIHPKKQNNVEYGQIKMKKLFGLDQKVASKIRFYLRMTNTDKTFK